MEVLARVALVMVGWTGISVVVAAIVAQVLEFPDAERRAAGSEASGGVWP